MVSIFYVCDEDEELKAEVELWMIACVGHYVGGLVNISEAWTRSVTILAKSCSLTDYL